jgi:hypothetical protein
MPEERPTRDTIIRGIAVALEPLPYVYAMWEGGAVAFDRLDEWSDIDICVDADDSRVTDVFPHVEGALEAISRIEVRYDVPSPSLGEYVQAFYRLKDTSRFMIVDLAVFKHSAEDKLLEPEIHGGARFHFNKGGAVRIPSLDRDALRGTLRARLERIGKRYDMFGCFVEKEIMRANWIEALDLYYRLILDSLIEILRIKHRPVRHDFRTRYIRYDLPGDVVGRLCDLYFVRDEEDLRGKLQLAREWLEEMLTIEDLGQ